MFQVVDPKPSSRRFPSRLVLTSPRLSLLVTLALLCGAPALRADNFYTLTPCRVFDSRATPPPLQGGVERFIPVAGLCGVPVGATAVSLNITVTNATAGGDMEIGRGDATLPDPATTRVSFQPNKTRANNGLVQIATDGVGGVVKGVKARAAAAGTTTVDLILDVNGYFFPGPPVAVDDHYDAEKDTVLNVGAATGVTSNDTLGGGAIASYGATTGSEQTTIGAATPTSAGGSITLNADGSFSYTPPSGAVLIDDTFKYVLQNLAGTSSATVTISVGKASQTIAFTSTAPAGATVGGPTYNVTATATSGLTVTFTIDASAASVCTIAGSTVSFIGVGTCVIDANQAGDANYQPAPQVQQSFAVAKGDQTISFTSTAPADAKVGGPTYLVTATAGSGLPVSFTIDASATSVCSIAGSTVSFLSVGTCVINANQAGDANWNAAPQVQQSFAVGKGDQTITFTSSAPGSASVGGPTYTVTATATSGLSVTFTIDASATSVCSIAGSTVSFLTAGTCVIDANQAGDANWNAAPQAQQSFAVGKASQTISFTSTAPVGATVGGPTYNVTATATSGLTVTFTIDATATSVCSIAGSTVSFIGVGTCVIDADQAGDANYNAAPQVQQSFAVVKGDQTISFTSTAPVGAKVGGPTYNVTATATSGLTVTFSIDASATSVCSIAGSTVTFLTPGTCVIDANQAGDAAWNAAPQVQQSFAVAKGDQTISFTSSAPVAAKVGGPTYTVTATATSGLAVTFTIDVSAASVCTIAGSTVSFIGAGTCVIDANQGGDGNWNAAPQAQQSFSVAKGDQTISFTSTAPVGQTAGGPTYNVTATATSGLTVTFTIDASATSVCSIAGSTVSFIGSGTCVINANQAGDANWNAAPQVQQSFAVVKQDQTISFTSSAPVGAQVGVGSYNVTATATSGLTVTFTIDASATSVCSIAGSTVTFIGAGTCVIDANQAGNAVYNAAPQVQQSFLVVKQNQTITFTSTPPSFAIIGGTYTVTATASSGLPVTFTIDASATSVCSIAGSTVTANAGGTCVINANQAGNGTYNPAPQVQQSYSVNFPPQLNPAPGFPKETFDTVGNTQLELRTGAATVAPGIKITGQLKDNFVDSDGPNPLSVVPITAGATTNGGQVDVGVTGQFLYTPKAGDTAASDSFGYQVTDGAYTVSRTVTVNLKQRVWYVKNDAAAGGLGRSNDPFDTLAEAETAGVANDYIFVYLGDGANTGQAAGIVLKAGQHLIGEHEGLGVLIPTGSFNGTAAPTTVNLVTASPGNRPLIEKTGAGNIAVSATNVVPAEISGVSLLGGDNAIDFTSTAALGTASFTIKDNVLRGALVEGIDINLNAGTTGTVTLAITGNAWDGAGTHAGNAVDVNRVAGTLNLNFSNNTGILSTGANGVVINGGSVANTTITGFADNSVSGNTVGSGVSISNVTFDQTPGAAIQQVDGNTLVIGVSGNPVTSSGLALTTVQGNLFFDDLDVFGGTSAVFVSGTGSGFTFAVTPASPDGSGTSEISAGNGAALDVTSAAIDLRLSKLTSTTAGSGLSLSSTSGQFKAPSGSAITKSSGGGTAFSVASGSVAVDYGGTLNVTAGAGVSLSSNSGAMNFTGQMTLSTGSNTAFSASGGGTVTATDTTSTLTTTTATALNVANTTIGSNGLKFQSISAGTAASGPTNGIVLNTTGSSGGLTVLGAGSAGSGGTIQKCTGPGISLSSTSSVNLSWMNVQNGTDDGIRGTSVNGFSGTRLNVSGNGNAAGEAGMDFNALTGAVSLTNVTVTGSAEDNVVVRNSSGTLSSFTVTGSTFSNNSSIGNDGILLDATGTASMTANVSGSTFSANRGDHFQASAANSATLDITFSGNTLTGGHATALGQGVTINAATAVPGYSGSVNYTISNNTINGAILNAIQTNLGTSASGATMHGTISGNQIGTTGSFQSGSTQGSGIGIDAHGNGTHTLVVSGNIIRQVFDRGITVLANDGSGTLNLTVTGNNSTHSDGTNSREGFFINAGSADPNIFGVADAHFVCLSLGGAGALKNTLTHGPGAPDDFRLRQRFNTTIRLPGYAGAVNDTAAVVAFVNTNNTSATGSATVNTPPGGGFVGGAACPQ